MEVAILEPQEVLEFGTEYVFSAYVPEPDSLVPEVKSYLSSRSAAPTDMHYVNVRDYEGNLHNPSIKTDYAVYFLDSDAGDKKRGAYYIPLSGKSNLKRRRTGRGKGEPNSIELRLRERTEEEDREARRLLREFEMGGPKEDGLSDTDAPGEVDPTYAGDR
jgi:Paf1